MVAPKAKNFTREEELLLQDFSRKISTKNMALFYGIAFIVSVVPLWLFLRIHHLDPYSYAVVFVVGSLVNTYFLAFSYNRVKYVLKNKIVQNREDAIAKEVLQSLSNASTMNKKEKDERILWKKNMVSNYEATTYSIFFNNAIFYTFVVLASFYIFRNFTPTFNYLFSVVGSGALIALLSTGSM